MATEKKSQRKKAAAIRVRSTAPRLNHPVHGRLAGRLAHTPDFRVIVGRTVYLSGGTAGPRWQAYYHLMPVHGGEASIRVDEMTVKVLAQEVALLLPGHEEFMTFSSASETDHSYCRLMPQYLPPALRAELLVVPKLAPLTPRLDAILQTALMASPDPIRSDALQHLAVAAFAEYRAAATQHARPESRWPDALHRVLQLVREHHAEPLNLDALAKVAALSPNHLIRLFRERLKTTPARHLWQARVEHASKLLVETGLSISEIAYRTGFQNPFHCSRLLKRHLGSAPSDYRLRMWSREVASTRMKRSP